MIRLTVEDLRDLGAAEKGIAHFAKDFPNGATFEQVMRDVSAVAFLSAKLLPVQMQERLVDISDSLAARYHHLGWPNRPYQLAVKALLRDALWAVWPYDGTER